MSAVPDPELITRAAHYMPLEDLEELKLEDMRAQWTQSLGQHVRFILTRQETHRDLVSAIRTDTKHLQMVDVLMAERNKKRQQ